MTAINLGAEQFNFLPEELEAAKAVTPKELKAARRAQIDAEHAQLGMIDHSLLGSGSWLTVIINDMVNGRE